MNGIVLGIAMLVSSTGVSPALETTRATVAPSVFTFTLPDHLAAESEAPRRFLDEQQRTMWHTGAKSATQPARTRRFSPTDRIIALAAGVAVGWVAGGAIGYKLTDNPSNPDDDTSGLRGVIIGAPIGAATGAILGWRLTDR